MGTREPAISQGSTGFLTVALAVDVYVKVIPATLPVDSSFISTLPPDEIYSRIARVSASLGTNA